mgnify:CR=1 FL=1
MVGTSRFEDAAIARKAAAMVAQGRFQYSCNALDNSDNPGFHLKEEYKKLFGHHPWFCDFTNAQYVKSIENDQAQARAWRVGALQLFASYLEMGVL